MATKAFSYLRFSTGEQERGDSFRRQRDLATRYCAEHGLELDGRSFHDLGISGFRGANVRNGALGAFLRAVDDGIVQPGEYLLVENLDRVSRQKPWDALPIFQQIINAGVVVVTLQDRRRYSREDLEANPFLIMESLLSMLRAHQESDAKAQRLRAVWAAKRAAIAERPMTARCPGWLTLEPTPPRRFQVLEDRAAIVRRIFRDTLAGIGQDSIARRLNKDGVPPFGRSRFWQRSYIKKVLSNPAVVGDFRPHLDEYTGGKRVRRPLDVVRGYFPPVVDRKDFATVQSILADRKAPKAHGIVRNLLSSLGACPRCGGSMTRVTKATRKKPAGQTYLACNTQRFGGACDMPAVPYADVERALVASVDVIVTDVPNAVGVSNDALAGQRRLIADLEARHGRILEAIETGDLPPAPFVVSGVEGAREQIEHQRQGEMHLPMANARLRALEGEIAAAKAESQRLEARLAAVDGPTLRARLRELREAVTSKPLDCGRANVALRALFSKVIVDRGRGFLTLHWTFGGLTEVPLELSRPDDAPTKSDHIRGMLANGLSAGEIAAKIGCSADYVRVIKSRDARTGGIAPVSP
jgi:DNA invertase Pin-like site-specific DNA recombinase